MFLGLVASRIRVEYAYYKLVESLPKFRELWGINEVLCTLHDNELVLRF